MLGKYMTLAAMIGGFVAGSAVGGFGVRAIYDGIVLPAQAEAHAQERETAVAAAQLQCEERMTAAISLAAETARAAERMRLERVHATALDDYRAELEAREAQLAAARAEQETRDRQHENELMQGGRSCPLDAGDIDYLNGTDGMLNNGPQR